MHSLRRLAALVILSSLGAAALDAQGLTFGEITGTVSDAARRPIADAEVRVRDRTSGATRWVLTTREGRYRLRMLPGGRYDVTIEALGFRPLVQLDVAVAAGFTVDLNPTLAEASFPVTTIDTARAPSLAVQPGNWLVERGYADLVGARRTLSDLAALSTSADELGVEGLPWRLAGSMVDGVRSAHLAAPYGPGAEGATLSLPVRAASAGEVGGLGFDVEVGGTGVGARMTTRRAGRTNASSMLVEGGSAAVGGAFIAGGPLQGDTAQAIFGVDFQRSDISRPALTGADAALGAALSAAALNSYGRDVSAYAAPANRVSDRAGAFARLDWQPGDRFAVSMRASGSRYTSSGLPEPGAPFAGHGRRLDAIGVQASLNVMSQLSRRISHELRVSADVASLEGRPGSLPATSLVEGGLALGAPSGFDESRTTPRASALLHLDFGAHRLKAGVAVSSHLAESRFIPGSTGEYRFGDVADFDAGLGAWRGVADAVPAGEFRMGETSFLLQDAWRVTDGFSVSFGGRLDIAKLPRGEIEAATDWRAVSGLDNRDVDRSRSALSPRLGVRWELGRDREWLVEGGAGVFQELPQGRDIAEALTFDRGAEVRTGVGALGPSWPGMPDAAAAPVAGHTLTVLGPDFQGPRTRRFALSLTRRFGAWSATVGGTYRHSDFLARRRELNRFEGVSATDQYGRPLLGDLQQAGTLLAAQPGSGRRFAGFERVHLLEATGFSDYWAASLGLERLRDEGFSLSGSYTFSRTSDNVPGLGDARLSPFPDGLAGLDWTDGRSDLDVPHRLVLAGEWASARDGALRLGAVYRLSSGLPFTPGVRDGVDANADGDAQNDPAFVDPALAGMSALLAEHSCLGVVSGFVERNACRGDLVHRLDVRASIRVATLAIGRIDLVLDALDVIATETGRVDHALLLVDRAGAITPGPGSTVNVPYVVNPAFGARLADRSPGILWRAGLRIVP